MTKEPTNLPASIRQKLLNYSREHREDFMLTLTHFAVERLLYRLSRSRHANRFILKGAMLFAVWTDQPYRPTRDVDFLGTGDPSAEALAAAFREICTAKVEPDGLEFDPDSIRINDVREEQNYPGKRIRLVTKLGNAVIPLQIDIGYGDPVTAGPETIKYPTLLNLPAPEILAYTRETLIAEKLQAMVALGRANSRMRDYSDILMLSREFPFDGRVLSAAIQATFQRRGTPLRADLPDGLSDQFADDAEKNRQWEAFRRRAGLDPNVTLANVVTEVRRFLQPPMTAAGTGKGFEAKWPAGGPWQ